MLKIVVLDKLPDPDKSITHNTVFPTMIPFASVVNGGCAVTLAHETTDAKSDHMSKTQGRYIRKPSRFETFVQNLINDNPAELCYVQAIGLLDTKDGKHAQRTDVFSDYMVYILFEDRECKTLWELSREQ